MKVKSRYQRIKDEVFLRKTGKPVKEWCKILDKFDRKKKGHTLTAKHLQEKYKVSPWWVQVITIRYEWDKGLRTTLHKGED